jgi:HK97 family phage major capsid protein
MKNIFKNKTVLFLCLLFAVALTFALLDPLAGGAMSIASLVPIWGSIKEGTFKELSVDEIAKLSDEEQAQYFADKAEYQKESLRKEFKQMIDDAKKGLISEESLKSKLGDFEKKLEGFDSQEIQTLKTAVKKNQDLLDDYEEKLKTQGIELKKLQDQGIITPEGKVNKGIIRSIVEDFFEKSGLLGEEIEENGVKIRPINLKSNQTIGESAVTQVKDVRRLSTKHLVRKAGENMFIGGTGTQAVSGQGINRTSIGSIAPPLTANDHAIDLFTVQNISGSLMNLLVYENLEANGELVAEGAAPSADSRIELNDKDFKVFDFSATATIGKSLLRDSAEVMDELVNQLASNIKTVLDENIFTADGDNSASPWGAFNTTHSCDTFNPLLFTGQSPKANIVSVIGKAKLQARLNDWNTDMFIMNPRQEDELEDLKDANENSIKDNRLAVNAIGEIVGAKGMMKGQTTKIPEGSLLVCNSGLERIGLRQDIETAFGYNADDLKKRKVSFVMDMRGAYGQKAKKSAIYVTNIAEAITILKETAGQSLARVQGYATSDDASELTIATLVNAGVTGALEANLAEYKATIAGEASIENLAALQTLIDTDNAD